MFVEKSIAQLFGGGDMLAQDFEVVAVDELVHGLIPELEGRLPFVAVRVGGLFTKPILITE
jgi:ATP-dependent protease Clp ATPase subunit